MPIVNMLSNRDATFPEGAYCSLEWSRAHNHRAGATPEQRAIVLHETHIGLCIAEREHNMRDDSDFYMTVWDAEKGEPKEIMFASTRGWSYPCMASRVDATPEVMAAFNAWRLEAARKREAETERQRIAYEARTPSRGKRVRVIAGRKIPKGTEAEVFWFGKAKEFGHYPRNGYMAHGRAMSAFAKSLAPYAGDPREGMRVGLLLADGTKVFTAATNVEVIS